MEFFCLKELSIARLYSIYGVAVPSSDMATEGVDFFAPEEILLVRGHSYRCSRLGTSDLDAENAFRAWPQGYPFPVIEEVICRLQNLGYANITNPSAS